MMYIDQLIEEPVAWMSRRNTGVVISSRVRLARNIKDIAFPGWAGEQELIKVNEKLVAAFSGLQSFPDVSFFEMGQLEEIDKQVLIERNLISKELAEKGAGSVLAVTGDRRVAAMINEEDHLRLQAVAPGLNLQFLWNVVDEVDSALEEKVDFAFSSKLGYLTSCPSNIGTGLRASAMLHLAGLKLTGELEGVLNGLNALGLAVRGIMGEGTKAFGGIFQVSNQSTLGVSEQEIIDNLDKIINELIVHEQNARMRLLEDKPAYLLDYIFRAYAILSHSRLLASGESIELLSALRLGVDMGMVKNLSVLKISEIMLITQPGHLQKVIGRPMEEEERDSLRASLIRDKLRRVKVVDDIDEESYVYSNKKQRKI